MIDGMPRPLPLYVQRERSRHGKTVFYFRIGKGERTRLPDIASPDFQEEYVRAFTKSTPEKKPVEAHGTLGWLIQQYRQSSAYLSLSQATRRQRDSIFGHVIQRAGRAPYKAITRKIIVQGREDRKETPAQARNFLDAMRGLFRWSVESDLLSTDPTEGVRNPPRPKGEGFAAWTDEDVSRYEARWPAGSRERVWMHVLLYTGLRRGDAVKIGWQHVRDGVAMIRTEKTGTEIYLTIRPELDASLRRGPTGDLAWIAGVNGRPFVKESFGTAFRIACREAGITKSAHGLRKLAATKAAEAGLSVSELEALFGWTGGTMASHYTRTADRKRLALQAAGKIGNAGTPHLNSKTPHLKNNT